MVVSSCNAKGISSRVVDRITLATGCISIIGSVMLSIGNFGSVSKSLCIVYVICCFSSNFPSVAYSVDNLSYSTPVAGSQLLVSSKSVVACGGLLAVA